MKRCSGCKKIKQLTAFKKRPLNPDGYAAVCIRCSAKSRRRSAVWVKSHPEENRAKAAAWAKKNPEKRRIWAADYRKRKRRHIRSQNKKWRRKNRKSNAIVLKAWRLANKEKVNGYSREWGKRNPEYAAVSNHRRIARRKMLQAHILWRSYRS